MANRKSSNTTNRNLLFIAVLITCFFSFVVLKTMASVDQAQLTRNEQSTINQMMKQAQVLLANNKDNSGKNLATAAAVFKNSQAQPILLSKKLFNVGSFVVEPTANIGGFESGSFMGRSLNFNMPHIPGRGGGPGPVIIGSKGAVIYGTNDEVGPQLGWLLAWFKAQSSNEHKVYVEAGLLEDLMKKKEDEIEDKLNASGSVSSYVDNATGSVVAAQIELQGNNAALLGATFEVLDL